MKKTITLLALSMALSSVFAQAVRDKNTNNQLKSMEFQQWKFTPKWYYFLLHNSYRKKDKRNMYQEAPLVLASELTKQQADSQAAHTDVVYQHELVKFADKTIDYQYILTKDTREYLYRQIDEQFIIYAKNKGNPEHISTLVDEVSRIVQNVEIIQESHLSNAKKREAYLNFEKELQRVLTLARRLNNLIKLKPLK